MWRLLELLYIPILKWKWGLSRRKARGIARIFLSDYRKRKMGLRKTISIHNSGYSVNDWRSALITKETKDQYLTTIQYHKMHPMNGEYTKWIDDKLTMKYLCAGTPLDTYMTRYYYLIDAKGTVHKMCDCHQTEGDTSTVEDIVSFLRHEGVLAFKLRSGAIGKGFYKAEYHDDNYFLNGHELCQEDLSIKIKSLRDCLVVEYLRPHPAIAKFCPNVTNTLRYLSVKLNNSHVMLKSFIRFGTKKSGFVENYNKGGILCYIDEQGVFTQGHQFDFNTGADSIIQQHPDNQVRLHDNIPHWSDIQTCVHQFHEYFPMLQYLGFDFVVTDNDEVKILEINSMTSLDSLQLEGSILNSKYGEFFKQKLSK